MKPVIKMPSGYSMFVSVQFHLNWRAQCSTLTGVLRTPSLSQGSTVHAHILCSTQILTLGMCYLNHSYILDSFMFKSEKKKKNILILHKYHMGTQWHGPCWSSLEVKWKSRNRLRTDLSFYLPVQLYDSYLRKKESRQRSCHLRNKFIYEDTKIYQV